MGKREYDWIAAESGKPDWRAHVVGECHERGRIRPQPAVYGNSVSYRAHSMLPNAERDICACLVFGLEKRAAFHGRIV